MSKHQEKIQVYAYARVSGKSQCAEDKDGIRRQERAIKAYADAHGMEIIKFYRDEGVSGTKDTEDRPALAELMVSLEQNGHGVKMVLIERLDRLARDLMVQEGIIKDFNKNDFKLISVVEGDDLLSNDPTRKLIRQVLGAIAGYDKDMTVLKLRAARQRKKQMTGKCEGQKKISDSLEGETVISLIKKLRKADKYGRKTKTFDQIAEILNTEGHTTKNGKPFTMANVANIYHRYAK